MAVTYRRNRSKLRDLRLVLERGAQVRQARECNARVQHIVDAVFDLCDMIDVVLGK